MKAKKRKQGAQPKFSVMNDKKLVSLVKTYGTDQWNKIAQILTNKTPKQCKDRWNNYLNPTFKHKSWTLDDDQILIDLYNKYGPKWTVLSKAVGTRSASEMRYRYLKIKRFASRHNVDLNLCFTQMAIEKKSRRKKNSENRSNIIEQDSSTYKELFEQISSENINNDIDIVNLNWYNIG